MCFILFFLCMIFVYHVFLLAKSANSAECIIFLMLMRYMKITFNTLKPERNGHHCADDIFKWIFLINHPCVWTQISVKFVLKGSIDNTGKLALVQVMAWWQAITWTNADPVHWCIHALLGLNVLIKRWILSRCLPVSFQCFSYRVVKTCYVIISTVKSLI